MVRHRAARFGSVASGIIDAYDADYCTIRVPQPNPFMRSSFDKCQSCPIRSVEQRQDTKSVFGESLVIAEVPP
jgi:hypothetical protein